MHKQRTNAKNLWTALTSMLGGSRPTRRQATVRGRKVWNSPADGQLKHDSKRSHDRRARRQGQISARQQRIARKRTNRILASSEGVQRDQASMDQRTTTPTP